MAEKDKEKTKALREKTNINGSAIAVGHPNTASGASPYYEPDVRITPQGRGSTPWERFAVG